MKLPAVEDNNKDRAGIAFQATRCFRLLARDVIGGRARATHSPVALAFWTSIAYQLSRPDAAHRRVKTWAWIELDPGTMTTILEDARDPWVGPNIRDPTDSICYTGTTPKTAMDTRQRHATQDIVSSGGYRGNRTMGGPGEGVQRDGGADGGWAWRRDGWQEQVVIYDAGVCKVVKNQPVCLGVW